MIWLVAAAMAQTLSVNGSIEHLGEGTAREQLGRASWLALQGPPLEIAGVQVDPRMLAHWAALPDALSLEDTIRRDMERAIDLDDFLLLLDDAVGSEAAELVVTAGRARSAGVMVHPREVFSGGSRDTAGRRIRVERPAAQPWVPPAEDGSPLGVRWTTRFANPSTAAQRLQALTDERGDAGFAEDIAFLGAQLEAQGAQVWVTSTARDPRRGYLLWGSFILSQQVDEGGVERTIDLLQDRNQAWQLDIPIEWAHPDGWQSTISNAQQMAETYDVVYATEGGARSSNHYGGRAVDMVALALPDHITLVSPLGDAQSFDLSAPAATHDLSLEPDVVQWIEDHYVWAKLRGDYPHWSDVSR